MSFDISKKILNVFPDVFLAEKYAKSFVRNIFTISSFDIELENNFFLKNYKKDIISNIALDGTPIQAIEIKQKIETKDTLLIVKPFQATLLELEDIVQNFFDFGYNVFIVTERKQKSFGYLESFDLLVWIDYLSNQKQNIYLYGEGYGANTIIYALNSKLNNNVISCVLDDPNPYVKNELIEQYVDAKNIHSSKLLEHQMNLQIKNAFGFTLDNLNLGKHLNCNELKMCMVFSKHRNKNRYYEILKVYNQTKGIKKFYFTDVVKRNYKQENYFEVLNNFYKN